MCCCFCCSGCRVLNFGGAKKALIQFVRFCKSVWGGEIRVFFFCASLVESKNRRAEGLQDWDLVFQNLRALNVWLRSP